MWQASTAEPVRRIPVPAGARRIAVAVRDVDEDAAALTWAAFDAMARVDSVHVVHAYEPVRLDGCVWEPVLRERDKRRHLADRAAARAAQRLRASRDSFPVDSSAIGGTPEEVLCELSTVADLIVVGADRPSSPTSVHRVAEYLLGHTRCPVVCVPRGHRLPDDGAPVTVIGDDQGLPATALEFAAGYAQRHGVALQVSRAWSTLHEGDHPDTTWLAHQQEELDTELAGWREGHRDVAVSARIELDDDWLPRLAAYSALLVVPAAVLAVEGRGGDPAWLHCPTAVVPTARRAR